MMKKTTTHMLLAVIVFVISAAQTLALPAVSEIAELRKAMNAHRKDLLQLAKYSRGSDQDAAPGLVKVSEQSGYTVDHVYDLIYIYSLVTNDADKTAILSFINLTLSFTSKEIDLSIEDVNFEVSAVKGVALVAAADQLKADLRKLQTMIAARH